MKDWEQFEVAVEHFIAALDSRVTVRRNVRLPDRDTGHLRQRDVWIDTKICGVFPISVLISCKRWASKLDESDVDAFVGELRSSGAHKGVIYSAAGFSEPAIQKARALGISCCRLYQDEQADIPESLMFAFYCAVPQCRLRIDPTTQEAWGDLLIGDLMARPASPPAPETVLDEVVREFHAAEDATLQTIDKGPRSLQAWMLQFRYDGDPPIILYLDGRWLMHRAKLEARLLNGSYSFTENQFLGTQYSPWVDIRSAHPGPHWEVISEPPEVLPSGLGLIVLRHGDLRHALTEQFGPKRLRDLS